MYCIICIKKLKNNRKIHQIMNETTCTYSQEYITTHCFQQCKTTLIYQNFFNAINQ